MASAPGASSLGLAITKVPDGVYVSAVAPGGPADKAGLKPGMVVTSINGIGTRSLAFPVVEAMLKSSDGDVAVQTVGGGYFTITMPPSTKREGGR